MAERHDAYIFMAVELQLHLQVEIGAHNFMTGSLGAVPLERMSIIPTSACQLLIFLLILWADIRLALT